MLGAGGFRIAGRLLIVVGLCGHLITSCLGRSHSKSRDGVYCVWVAARRLGLPRLAARYDSLPAGTHEAIDAMGSGRRPPLGIQGSIGRGMTVTKTHGPRHRCRGPSFQGKGGFVFYCLRLLRIRARPPNASSAIVAGSGTDIAPLKPPAPVYPPSSIWAKVK